MLNQCHIGNCLELMRDWPDECVQTCVTSPPYWGLRDYGVEGQLGAEPSYDDYIKKMVLIFEQVHRLLKSDGTLWLNLGDTYSSPNGRSGGNPSMHGRNSQLAHIEAQNVIRQRSFDLPAKNLIGIPWRVALALQNFGWYLRSDIIWHKPNPMPESVRDRPTGAHEYLFLLSKSEKYYYDHEAIKEKAAYPDGPNGQVKSPYGQGFTRADKQRGHGRRHAGFNERWDIMSKEEQQSLGRNKRSVWTVATKPYSEAHFATFPPELIEPCILAGSRTGDVVLDPFLGSGTTAQVAQNLGRQWIGCELNPEYLKLQNDRTRQAGLSL